MLLSFFNPSKPSHLAPQRCRTAQDVLENACLTVMQKLLVLEAMLHELRESLEEGAAHNKEYLHWSVSCQIEDIIKAQNQLRRLLI